LYIQTAPVRSMYCTLKCTHCFTRY
jgi:hypothetical protein